MDGWLKYGFPLVLGAAIGAGVKGYFSDGAVDRLKLQHLEAVTAAYVERDKARAELKKKQAEWEKSDTRAQEAITRAKQETEHIRSAVDADAYRLYVRASCPDSARVPETGAGAGVVEETSAQLDTAARSDYYALRDQIIETEEALKACQSRLP